MTDRKLSHSTAKRLQGAILWESAGEKLEVEVELGNIEPAELDLAVEATAEVLETLRRLRDASLARLEATRR